MVDAACGGSITTKTRREANQLFEELAKNNYQPPLERNVGRRQGDILEMDRVSSLEVKFEALMTKLNQQTPKEPTLGEIAYMQAQGAMKANPPYQVEESNYLSNRGYMFRLNNNLPLHYHSRLRNQSP